MNMKAIYQNIALAALAIGAAACTQEDDFSSSYLNDPDAVRITAQVGAGNDVTGGFTRSNPIDEDAEKLVAFNADDQIAVTADSQDAVTYTYDGTSWTPETGKYLKWQSDEMTFTAWYPASEGTDAQNFTPSYGETASPEELAANDYMTYTGSLSKGEDHSVSLAMQRQMVRIMINSIEYGNQYDATTNAVTAIAVTAGKTKYENGEWTGEKVTAQMYKLYSENGRTDVWYAVLPPTATAEADETYLSITLATGEKHTVKGIPATTAGCTYCYSLQVGRNVASITGVKVNDWTSGTITGGEAGEVTDTEE